MIRPNVAQPNHGGYLYYIVPADSLNSESGHDNPFRPDGDISKEADEIVHMIKCGVPLNVSQKDSSTTDGDTTLANAAPCETGHKSEQLNCGPPLPPGPHASNDSTSKKGANGAAPSPGTVELKHATVTASEAAQVEHVVLKKKKQRCCVIQ